MERLISHGSEEKEEGNRRNSSDKAGSGPGGEARDGTGFAARAHSLLEGYDMYQSLVDYRAQLQQRVAAQRVSSAAQVDVDDDEEEEEDQEEESRAIIEEAHVTAREALQARLDYTSSEDGGEDHDCVICWSNEAVVALIPCGHVCLCSACSALSICPMCRSPVSSTMRVCFDEVQS